MQKDTVVCLENTAPRQAYCGEGVRLTILGCGASPGVPLIGCGCATCRSENLKNRRTRASVLIEQGGKRLLVDTSPDLRQQALRENFATVDAILYTHAHADHTHGIDEVRSFNFHAQAVIPAYGIAATRDELVQRFDYAFLPPMPEYGWFRPALEWHVVPDEPITRQRIADMQVTLFRQQHGPRLTSLGIRVGGIAYSTDVNHLDEAAFEALEGVEIWVVDCLTHHPVPTHAYLEQALAWIERVKPRHAVLTHMNHVLEYDALSAQLPNGVEPAYDGLRLEWECPQKPQGK